MDPIYGTFDGVSIIYKKMKNNIMSKKIERVKAIEINQS